MYNVPSQNLAFFHKCLLFTYNYNLTTCGLNWHDSCALFASLNLFDRSTVTVYVVTVNWKSYDLRSELMSYTDTITVEGAVFVGVK